MKSCLRSIDFFGSTPYLYIDKHQQYKTLSGGIATIIVSILTIGLTLTFSVELIYKTKPSVRTVSTSNSNTSLNLNRSDFFFSYVTVDGKGRPFKYDPKFTLLKSYMEHTGSRLINNTSILEKNDITFIDCKEEYIQGFENVSKEIKEVITLYGKCLALNKNVFYSSPKISPSISQFKLEILHNVEVIQELYKTVFPYNFYIFYQNIAFDTLNYKKPTTKALGFQKYEILSDTMIVVSAEISILYTDTVVDQLLTEKHIIKKGYGVDSLNAFKNMVQEEENGLRKHLEITLSLSDSTINYIREYPTILDMFSKMGGMIQIILMITHIIVNYLIESEILWYLYHKYFNSTKQTPFRFIQNEMHSPYNNNNNINNNTIARKTNIKYLTKLYTTQLLTQSNLNSMMKNLEYKGCINKLNNSDSLLKYDVNLKKDYENSKVMLNPYLQEYSISKEVIANKKCSALKSNFSTMKVNVNNQKKEEQTQQPHNELIYRYYKACCLHYCSKNSRGVYKTTPFDIIKEALDINNYFVMTDELNIIKFILINKDNKELIDTIDKYDSIKKKGKLIERAKRLLNANNSMQSFQS